MSAAAPELKKPSLDQADRGEDVDVSSMHAAILREKSDPVEGYEPVPLWLIAVIGTLLFWGGYYFGQFAANFSPYVLDTLRPTQIVTAPIKTPPSAEVLGQRTYNISCAPCHQADGNGVPGQFPPLANSEWVLTQHPGRIIRLVLHGLNGPITVRGQVYNNAMPAWGENLSDDQIAAVVTFIRNQWNNRASAATPEQVAEIRAKTQDRAAPWTASELLSIPEDG